MEPKMFIPKRSRGNSSVVDAWWFRPREDLVWIGVPDATPELISQYALDDEQALLAIVRYNRLIDIFLGLATYSLQNHLRTTVKGIGQIEIDELYIGLDSNGCHYAIPVQAKGEPIKLALCKRPKTFVIASKPFTISDVDLLQPSSWMIG